MLNDILYSGIIKKAFEIIEEKQKANHTSQIDNIITYLRKKGVKGSDIRFLKNVLTLEEKIFWCIDDIIDKQYEKSVLLFYNETVKFVSSVLLFDEILNYQLKNKKDLSGLLLKKHIVSQKIISSIKNNLSALVGIPYEEKGIEKKISKTKDETKIKELLMKNQLNRSQNVKIYLGTAEAVCGIKIRRSPFLFFRALQLIREDIVDRKNDILKGNNNSFNILLKKFKNERRVNNILLHTADSFLDKISKTADERTAFLIEKAEDEKKKITKLLKTK